MFLGKLTGTELDKTFSDFGLTLLPIVVACACVHVHTPTHTVLHFTTILTSHLYITCVLKVKLSYLLTPCP
jgi:hypothetical protein